MACFLPNSGAIRPITIPRIMAAKIVHGDCNIFVTFPFMLSSSSILLFFSGLQMMIIQLLSRFFQSMTGIDLTDDGLLCPVDLLGDL